MPLLSTTCDPQYSTYNEMANWTSRLDVSIEVAPPPSSPSTAGMPAYGIALVVAIALSLALLAVLYAFSYVYKAWAHRVVQELQVAPHPHKKQSTRTPKGEVAEPSGKETTELTKVEEFKVEDLKLKRG